MSIETTFTGILTILLMILVGYFFGKFGFLTQEKSDTLSEIVIKITLKCMLFESVMRTFTREFISEMGFSLFIPLIVMLASQALGYLVAKLFRVKKSRVGLFAAMYTLSNGLFIGLPITNAIFGDASTPFAMAYYISINILCWTTVYFSISSDAGKPFKFDKNTLKQIATSPIPIFFGSIILSLVGVQFPDFVMDSARSIGNITTPAAMIIIGVSLSKIGKSAFKLDKDGWLVLLGRFILIPLLCLGICMIFGVPTLATNVYIIDSALPVMTMILLVARSVGADDKFAAQLISVSTVYSMVTIPITVLILQQFQ